MSKMTSVVIFALLLVAPINTEAVILIGTGDPTANTTAPEGDRGWSHIGVLHIYPYAPTTATVIGIRYVLSTEHQRLQIPP
jgi:hypothetical protein